MKKVIRKVILIIGIDEQKSQVRKMKDLIDKKNQMDKMKRSIIKSWNVAYGMPEVIDRGEQAGYKKEPSDYGAEDESYQNTEPQQEDILTKEQISKAKIEQILREKDVRLQKIIEKERRD